VAVARGPLVEAIDVPLAVGLEMVPDLGQAGTDKRDVPPLHGCSGAVDVGAEVRLADGLLAGISRCADPLPASLAVMGDVATGEPLASGVAALVPTRLDLCSR
jgi:hypothetical protein